MAARAALQTILFLAAMMALMVVPSRDWTWPASWFILAAPTLLVLLPTSLFIWAFNPDLIPERERFTNNPGTANFEHWILPSIVLLMPVRYLAMGLQHMQDMQQPGWSSTAFLATPTEKLAAAIIVLECLLGTYTICSNKYFSSVVRIQSDRGHKVCSQGPYAWVRHPSYVAFSLQGLAEAMLVHSPWAMVFAVANTLLLFIRTVYEDAFLQQSLPGYAAYAQKVRYRWVPLLW